MTSATLLSVVLGACLGTALTLLLIRFSRRGRERARAEQVAQVSALDSTLLPLLAALPSIVVLLDEDDEVRRASQAAYNFAIVKDDAVVEPRVAAMVALVRSTGRVVEKELTVKRGPARDAGWFYLAVRVAALGGGRVLILVTDRTAERRVEAMRADFLANVSHELKTPVGAISLLSETLAANSQDAALVADYAGRVLKESRRLSVLVQEIIELSRLQNGDALADPVDVELDAVVAEALDQVRVEAAAREVELVRTGSPGLVVRGDHGLLVTAVRNLLDNAIRYSDPRTRVQVAVGADPQDPSLLRLAVTDQGIGISETDRQRVFERFYRVDKARSRATGGTGLGLSIVKHVAADHGGTVELSSQLGQGSTFTLVLPQAAEAGLADGGAAAAARAAGALQGGAS
ncbi:sensor histidine kinase [Actinomyces weissii]|uniref:Sensor-like histidine kinase SenX3 n=1 Tax=Actinomyces weissii TaxID=675090 RepID=A0A7T7M934_9ACTO|nr:ATP-binding protein [Actinomyces weissii]QQM67179.1 two-component sensor histidine kinase [Actinomyces weissii]